MGDETRLELFNEIFLLILNQLIRSIPYERDIDPTLIADGMSVTVSDARRRIAGEFTGLGNEGAGFDPLPNGDDFYDLYVATLNFMEAEGFLRRAPRNIQGRSGAPGKGAVVTVKGIAAMNIPLPGKQKTVGQNIGTLLKTSGSEVRSAIISETVGTIMGAVAKGFIGQN